MENVDNNNEDGDDPTDQSPEDNVNDSGAHDPEPQQPRFSSRERRKTSYWCIELSAKHVTKVKVTNRDDPSVREAMSATPEERDI